MEEMCHVIKKKKKANTPKLKDQQIQFIFLININPTDSHII